MSEYSIALEKQLELLRFYDHPSRREYSAHIGTRIALGVSDIDDQWLAKNAHGMMVGALRHGEAYYWSAATSQLLAFAAPTLPNWTMPGGVLPAAGFFWFASPLPLPEWVSIHDGAKEAAPIAAISWVTDNTTIAFTSFELFKDHGPPGAPPVGTAYPTPSNYVFWSVGEDVATLQARTRSQSLGQLREEDFARTDLGILYIASAVGFIDQKLLSTTKMAPSRATRRRAEEMKHEPLLNVIELRRREHASTSPVGSTEERDYSCQWMVRGHWRQQWYPKLNRHQPKWITPYVKGPEDKPLKQPRATVFAVVR